MSLRPLCLIAAAAGLTYVAYEHFGISMSGTGDADPRSVLASDLSDFGRAISKYRNDHNGAVPRIAIFRKQMTLYTDLAGDPSYNMDETHKFGPYLRSIYSLPVGDGRGQVGVAAAPGPTVGWIYDEDTGIIRGNCDGWLSSANAESR